MLSPSPVAPALLTHTWSSTLLCPSLRLVKVLGQFTAKLQHTCEQSQVLCLQADLQRNLAESSKAQAARISLENTLHPMSPSLPPPTQGYIENNKF